MRAATSFSATRGNEVAAGCPRARDALHVLWLVALAGAAAGCNESLVSENLTQPDIQRVFATASAIEATIGTRLQTCHNSLRTGTDGIRGQSAVLAGEGFVGLPGSLIPRPSVGAGTSPNDYTSLGTNGRLAANAVTALDQLVTRGGTLGTHAQDLRARAFGFFAVGCHLGWLALAFDSAAITAPGLDFNVVPRLSGAADVMRTALALLDSAITMASDPASLGTGGFPLPVAWAGGNALSRDDFVRLVRSFRARFRAGVARTPDERALVDWPAIIADAENGVTSNFMVSVGGSTGWTNTWGGSQTSLPPFYYGMADVSGGYDSWLGLPLANRGFFLFVTPDLRWPQGATRAAQQAASANSGISLNATPYVSNRTDDPAGYAWGISYYQFRRMQYITNAGNTGLFPDLTRAELDLLAAEGYLRAGNIAAAAAKIDLSRVTRGGLPALSGVITSLSQPVPGGTSCVPRVPAPPAFTSTTCGTIWEALKWEKRMETAFTGSALWLTDSRGWGDLVEGTALEFPVPLAELGARHMPQYSLGGGLKSSALRGTYGF